MWIDEDGLPGRLDMCECERLLQCPNGTISALGSEDIYSCEVCVRASRTVDARSYWHLERSRNIAIIALNQYLVVGLELITACATMISLLLSAPWCNLCRKGASATTFRDRIATVVWTNSRCDERRRHTKTTVMQCCNSISTVSGGRNGGLGNSARSPISIMASEA